MQTLPALECLKLMQLSREGDRREGILLRQSRGWFQVSGMGHEPLAALGYLLEKDDYIFPYYRDRALCLSRGLSNYDLALAYFAKRESSSGGRHMPGHYSSRELNIFSVATPTASQCLPATGVAFGFKLENKPNVVITTVGDASTRQGEYYEAVAFAIQENLPVIFVVEDNLYGISTPTAAHNPYRLNIFHPDHVVFVNARDPYELFTKGQTAVAKARNGGGPTVLWCEMDRLSSHTSSDDHRVYRTAEDIAAMNLRDPIPIMAQQLIDAGEITEEEWKRIQLEISIQVENEYLTAEAALEVEPRDVMEELYSEEPDLVEAPPVKPAETMTMVSAINETLRAALKSDPKVIMMGEDIEDPKGGVFGLTKGLSSDFPNRVFNAPLAEATIIGAAVGLSASGFRPVFELQFIDFLSPGMNQLMTQVASLRWRSVGEWSCPMVLIAPCGAYLPGGSLWHSQSNEGTWSHIHGVRVCIPSTPEDAAGMLWTAIQGNDPTLVLVPKHIFRKRVTVTDAFPAVPLGKIAIRREGTDVTLVTWGNGTELADEAAIRADAEGISIEIVDLRSITPCDYEGIGKSLAKTGRLVVLHEDSRTGGFGQSVVSEMTARVENWNQLISAPQLVARMDTHVPYCPTLEYTVLPNLDQVMDAIHTVMQ
ncbi:MAG: thiamine pyrophosphate-dependent enzyme [Chthonomonadales bacterium]